MDLLQNLIVYFKYIYNLFIYIFVYIFMYICIYIYIYIYIYIVFEKPMKMTCEIWINKYLDSDLWYQKIRKVVPENCNINENWTSFSKLLSLIALIKMMSCTKESEINLGYFVLLIWYSTCLSFQPLSGLCKLFGTKLVVQKVC